MRPAEEEGLPEGDPAATTDAHWADLKRRLRDDQERNAARERTMRPKEHR